MKQPKDTLSDDDIALKALAFLAEDGERVARFLAASGLDPQSLRAAAAEPGFARAVLDHVAGDEALLLDFCAGEGLAPERVSAAWQRLCGTPHWP